MNYEKAYKAALKTATQWIKDGCTDKEKICLECIFPELREKEDEKIRKFLIDYFTSYKIGNVATKLNGYRIDDILAYLKKQKEQPKEELVYRLNGLMQDYIKEGKDDEEKEHRFKCYQLFWDALEDASYFEQKEQKIPDCCLKCNEYEIGYKAGYEHGCTAGYNKAMKEVDEQKEQKPAEWSEEDEVH